MRFGSSSPDFALAPPSLMVMSSAVGFQAMVPVIFVSPLSGIPSGTDMVIVTFADFTLVVFL